MSEQREWFQGTMVPGFGGAAPGRLILVVGPSGAGKDRLIAAARGRFAESGNPHFACRHITRPCDGGHEHHTPVSSTEYEAACRAGRYFLDWRAHGLGYALPLTVRDELLAGRDVVANVSRAVVGPARDRWPNTRVVLVTAPPQVLAERLQARRRESADDIARRLARAELPLTPPADITILNDGSFEDALRRFLDALAPSPALEPVIWNTLPG